MKYNVKKGTLKVLFMRRKKRNALPLVCLGLLLLLAGFLFTRINGIDVFGIDKKTSVSDVSVGNRIQEPPQEKQQKSEEQWELTLVNGTHPLAQEYQPPLQEVGDGYQFDARAAQSLEDMLDAAKAEGLSPIICSAYRTIAKQTNLYNDEVEKWKGQGFDVEEASVKAKTEVAYPGTSEHNLGLAADIVSRDYQMLDDGQAETPEAKWLKENCSKYGFILRYPPEKSDITGVIFEPWHYRYVGKEAAKKIMEEGICLEEYLGRR